MWKCFEKVSHTTSEKSATNKNRKTMVFRFYARGG